MNTQLTTTFKKLRKALACRNRYKFLRKALPNIADDESINLLTILEINGLDDALWALRATEQNCDRIARLMAADFVEEVIPLWEKYSKTNNRPQWAIQAARDFANGLIPKEKLAAARDAAIAAARAAARDAARDAWDAAWAAGDAAWDAWDAGAAAVEKQREIFVNYLKLGRNL